MKFLLLAFLIFLGCQIDSDLECTHPEQSNLYNQLVWICHNPESDNHGLPCTEECFEEGDTSAFCWILETDHCKQENLNPQRINAACEALDIR